ncbi:MAG: hypothetical protein A2Y12_16255 [Planctomycetes bacterium GWF2_42_9]|nr:MAG: hypothetical protein A2Y12_16255 [Planctomycetes bacterium GWF2_42_9]
MTKLALRSIVKICPGRYGSPPGPYWCSVCKREILQGEEYTAEIYQWVTMADQGDGALFCADCREIPVPDDFFDLTDSEAGKAVAKAAIDNLPRRGRR